MDFSIHYIIYKLIMYSIQEKLEPITRWYDNWLNGFHLKGTLAFKGQRGSGTDYISKVFNSQIKEIKS